MEQIGCLRTEEGPVYDVVRFNTVACQSVTIGGVRYVVEKEDGGDDLGSLEEPVVLHPVLAALAGQPAIGVRCKKKIPARNLIEARTIMQIVHDKFGTECMVFILYDKRTDEFITLIPKQTVTSTTCHVSAEDGVEGQTADIIMAADFHSHPFGSGGFLSGTDHDNHDSFQSVPIASFNFSPKPKIGDLYEFGVLEAEYGDIPLQQSQFTEPVDEVFIISDADRARWNPIIESKVHKSQTAVSSAWGAWQSSKTTGWNWEDDDNFGWPPYEKGFRGGKVPESVLLKKEDKPNILINGKPIDKKVEITTVDTDTLYMALDDKIHDLDMSFMDDMEHEDQCVELPSAVEVVISAETFIREKLTTANYQTVDDWPMALQFVVDSMSQLVLEYSELKSSDLVAPEYKILKEQLEEIENRLHNIRVTHYYRYTEVAEYCPPILILALYAFGASLSDRVAAQCREAFLVFFERYSKALKSCSTADTVDEKKDSADEVKNGTSNAKEHDKTPSGE